jgi:hypothetical protein
MDRLTHISITNCIKELDALEKLVISGDFSDQELADFLQEISWNLSNVFRRVRYDSDEFQCRLRKLIHDRNKKAPHRPPDMRDDEDGDE